MYSYGLLLYCYSCLAPNIGGELLCNNTIPIFINSAAHAIKGTAVQPKQKASNTNRPTASIRYKQYTVRKGEGLWQIATKKNVAKKNIADWINLVAKKNKLRVKDNNDDYILYEGDVIWIPLYVTIHNK